LETLCENLLYHQLDQLSIAVYLYQMNGA